MVASVNTVIYAPYNAPKISYYSVRKARSSNAIEASRIILFSKSKTR